MFRNIALRLIILCAIVCAGSAHAATDPTVEQVYEAARAGRLQEAQQMINQVLRDHPRSGKAHYVAAELYAKARDRSRARQELETAQALEPGLPFAAPAAVRALQEELSQSGPQRVLRTVPSARWSPPWATVIVVLAAIAILWLIFRRRSPAASAYSPQYTGGAPTSPGVPVSPSGATTSANVGSGTGSGIASGLASGVAVGAGVVAGEELARHLLSSDRGEVDASQANPPVEGPTQNDDMGGNDFGVSDGKSWDDDGGAGGQDGNDDDWT
jgi:hypothetical protein